MSCAPPIGREATLQRFRAAVMAGTGQGRRLLELRRLEAAIDAAERASQAILTAGSPAELDAALGAVVAEAWDAAGGATGADDVARLQAAWMSGAMPEGRRSAFERFATAAALRERLHARHPEAARSAAAGMPNLRPQVEDLVALLREPTVTSEPRWREGTLSLLMAAQRRALGVPDGPEGAVRWGELAGAYAVSMPAAERALFDRAVTAWAIQLRLRAAHPALREPEPVISNDEAALLALLEERLPALQDAQAATVPGSLGLAGVDRLAALLAEWEATLAASSLRGEPRAHLCFAMAGASFALGRGREQLLQPEAARSAYARAAELYAAGGEPEDAAVARDKATWLGFALRGDVDAASADDLRRMVDGVADPLARAATLVRLCGQARQANDREGARHHAERAAAALAEAGFADPCAMPVAATLAAWVEAAAARVTGNAVGKLIQRVGEQTMEILGARHAAAIGVDPAGAAAIEATLGDLQGALRLVQAQSAAVSREIEDGLRPYVALGTPTAEPDQARFDALLVLLKQHLPALETLAAGEATPSPDALAQAEALVAEAEGFASPGPIAQVRRVQSMLRQRSGDLPGAEAAAEAGEAALLQEGAGHPLPRDPSLFDTFLALRFRRCEIAAATRDHARVLGLAQAAIAAIEADRYRISDPFQQGSYLTDRTRFYELAAVAAFKLQRWDELIEISDLFKARAALRGRLAAAPDPSAEDLAREVREATNAIEVAPPDRIDALREHRRTLWNLLAMARMRSIKGETLPPLTLAALQAGLGPDEALVSWLWVAPDVFLVLALDRFRVQAEPVILDADGIDALARHVDQVRSGRMPRNSMELNVQPVAEAMLPPATRTFLAGAARLIFSPHRALHLVPLHAARLDGRFLIEHASVRYVPNLGSVLLPWSGTAVGTTMAVGINDFGRGLPPLRTAEAEAETVVAAWAGRGAATASLIGAAATRAAFTGLDLAGCRCLHLATHGQSVYATALGGDPFASRLCLADGDIEAMTLAGLPLRADLVVMSACHSGQRALALPGGRDLPGDDLFGLQATLFQAGVRSVIGALWTVDDASAPKLLPELHRRLAAGEAPEKALQGAVCAYLAGPDARRAIYFWAPLFMSSMGRMTPPTRQGRTG